MYFLRHSFSIAIAFLLWLAICSTGLGEEITLDAGQTVEIRDGATIVLTITGPASLEVTGRVGKWIQIRRPDGKGSGFILDPENADTIPPDDASATAGRLQTRGTDDELADASPARPEKRNAVPNLVEDVETSNDRSKAAADEVVSGNSMETEALPGSGEAGNAGTKDQQRRTALVKLLHRNRGMNFSGPNRNNYCTPVECVSFSPDGKYLIVGEENVKAYPRNFVGSYRPDSARNETASSRLVDLDAGTEIRRFNGHKNATYIKSVCISSDGRYAGTCGYDNNSEFGSMIGIPASDQQEGIIWDQKTGERLITVPGVARTMLFSHDNQWVVALGKSSGHSDSGEGDLSVYRISDLENVRELPRRWTSRLRHDEYVTPVISNDGKYLFARCLATDPNEIRQYDLKMAKHIASFGDGDRIQISHDDKILAVETRRTIVLWDVTRSAEIRRFRIERDSAVLAFNNDNTQLIAIGDDGLMNRWNIQTGKLVSQLAGFKNAKAVSPSSEVVACAPGNGAVDLIDLETGITFLRYTQYDQERTWCLEAITGAVKTNGREKVSSEDLGMIDPDGLDEPDDSSTSGPSGHQSVSDLLQLVRFSSEVEQTTPRPVVEEAPKRRLFVLCVGVSQYKYPEYNLAWARNDADAIHDFFLHQDAGLYDVVVQKYVNENASSENLKKGLQWMEASCRENDIAVIQFAGHGIKGRRGLYFMPHEADQEGIQYTCVNWADVAQTVNRIRARNIVMFNDCCHAGDFGIANRPSQEEVMAAFQKKAGLLLYCSSQPNQLSLESSELKHGLFTHAILSALSGAADSDADGQVTLGEMKQEVDRMVVELSQGSQTPHTNAEAKVDWDLPLARVRK